MVTLYYTRRYQQYLFDLFSAVEFDQVEVSAEIYQLLNAIDGTFSDNKHLLNGKINDVIARRFSTVLVCGGEFRSGIYENRILWRSRIG